MQDPSLLLLVPAPPYDVCVVTKIHNPLDLATPVAAWGPTRTRPVPDGPESSTTEPWLLIRFLAATSMRSSGIGCHWPGFTFSWGWRRQRIDGRHFLVPRRWIPPCPWIPADHAQKPRQRQSILLSLGLDRPRDVTRFRLRTSGASEEVTDRLTSPILASNDWRTSRKRGGRKQ